MNNLTGEKADLMTQINNLTEELAQSKQRTMNSEQNISTTELEETSSNNPQSASSIPDNKSNDSGVGLSESLQNGPRSYDTEGNALEDDKNGQDTQQVLAYSRIKIPRVLEGRLYVVTTQCQSS